MRSVKVIAVAAVAALGMQVAHAQDADNGQKVFKRYCAVCHSPEQGKNRVGPSLFGVVGRPAGSIPDFKYSDAMKGAGWTWDNDQLDKYLANPKVVVPGNKMIFAGVKKDEDRKDLIGYLDTLK